jgi:hypothetical protein
MNSKSRGFEFGSYRIPGAVMGFVELLLQDDIFVQHYKKNLLINTLYIALSPLWPVISKKREKITLRLGLLKPIYFIFPVLILS